MVGIHDVMVQDTLVVVVASGLGYLFKFALKPSKAEVRFISQILSLVVTVLIRWAADHVDTRYHLDRARQEFVNLTCKIRNSNKIEIG